MVFKYTVETNFTVISKQTELFVTEYVKRSSSDKYVLYRFGS